MCIKYLVIYIHNFTVMYALNIDILKLNIYVVILNIGILNIDVVNLLMH